MFTFIFLRIIVLPFQKVNKVVFVKGRGKEEKKGGRGGEGKEGGKGKEGGRGRERRDERGSWIPQIFRWIDAFGAHQRDTPAQNCIYIFWSTWKVYTMKYFSITKLFLIAMLRNNYLSPKCIRD